jgi:hypothetical protein
VFTVWYALSPYIKQIRFVFKGLIPSDLQKCFTATLKKTGSVGSVGVHRDRHGAVGIRLQAAGSRCRGAISHMCEKCSSTLKHPEASKPAFKPTQSPVCWIPGIMRPGYDADHSCLVSRLKCLNLYLPFLVCLQGLKQSLCRPEHAVRVPESWGFQISRRSAH